MTACNWIPKVKVGKELKDSKLFIDINSLANSRKEAKSIYLRIKHPDFLKGNPGLKKDENGEPLLSEVLKKYDLGENVTEKKILYKYDKELQKEVEGIPTESTPRNYMALMDRVIRFNEINVNSGVLADVIESGDTLQVKVQYSTKEREEIYKNKKRNHLLNIKLINILNEKGVSVGVLDNLQTGIAQNGVTDFSVAKDTADGLIEIIKIARGEAGQKALPEEFAHTILEMLNGLPLVQRLINNIRSNGLAAEILGEDYSLYKSLYANNETLLAKEAAGKLVAKHLLHGEEIENKPYKNVLQRLIDAIKRFFSTWSIEEFANAMIIAEEDSGEIAKGILNNTIVEYASLNNIISSEKLYNVEKEVSNATELLGKILELEIKRLEIFGNKNKKFADKQRTLIGSIEKDIAAKNELVGVIHYLNDAIVKLEELKKKSDTLDSYHPVTLEQFQEVAVLLRNISKYISSYKLIVHDLNEIIKYSNLDADDTFVQKAKDSLFSFKELIEECERNYNKHAFPIFEKFMTPYLEHELEMPFGKDAGKKRTVREILTTAEKDISIMDRLLDSMASSSSPILRALDEVVKNTKENARLEIIDFTKKIDVLYAEAAKYGITDFEYMFEKDEHGNKTDNYIQEQDWKRYYREKDELIKNIKEKYGDNVNVVKTQEYKDFMNKTWESVGNTRRMVYVQEAYANMTPNQKTIYKKWMELKEELDGLLPEGVTKLTKTIKIRKDLLQRLKSSDLSDIPRQLWEATKDQFLRRSDDEDYNSKKVETDFNNKTVMHLPLYYLKLGEGESNNDVSTDIFGTLKAYAYMAIDYHHMNKIVDILEIGREQLDEKLEIIANEGGKPLERTIKGVLLKEKRFVNKDPKNRLINSRIDDFMTMQVYSRYMSDEGTIGKSKLDTAKLAGHLAGLTAVNALGLNLLAAISNIATGTAMMNIEVVAQQYLKAKDLLVADGVYTRDLMPFLGDIGRKVKTSKLFLFDELFNVMQDFEDTTRDAYYDRAAIFAKMFGTDTLFFMTNGGEHWMQNRTALAVANSIRFKKKGDNSGETISLYEALEVHYMDPNNHSAGAKLKIKEGYVKSSNKPKEDGKEWTKEDTIKFTKRVKKINQKLHGIYNKLDRAAAQQFSIGRLAFMFRKWMKEFYNRRWGSVKYDHDLQEYDEGYYNSAGRFLKNLYKDLRKGNLDIGANWRNLHDVEKANIKRAMTDVGQFLAILLALMLVEGATEKDKYKKKKWYMNMLKYQLYRLRTELGVGVPSPYIATEIAKIADSPMASTSTFEDILAITGLAWPENYGEDAILKSGRFKDHTKAYKIFYESPYMVWAVNKNKQIYRAIHPEESIPFYKN